MWIEALKEVKINEKIKVTAVNVVSSPTLNNLLFLYSHIATESNGK